MPSAAAREPSAVVQPESGGDRVQVVCAHCPAERLEPALGLEYPACERASRGLGLVDDGDQLEVRVAERHDPVGRTPAGMAAARSALEPVVPNQLAGRRLEIRNGEDDVVELERYDPFLCRLLGRDLVADLLERAADQARDMHLRDPDLLGDLGLCQPLEEAEVQDPALALVEDTEPGL